MRYEELHLVVPALILDIEEALERVYAIEAFDELKLQKNTALDNAFLDLSYKSICYIYL